MTDIATREPANAISKATVISGSGRGRDSQIGIHFPKQPFGNFHPQGVGALVSPLLFQ